MPTKYGRQPFLDVLVEREITYRRAAEDIGVPVLHLRHAGYGYITGRKEFRKRIAVYLGMSQEELFTPESLAAEPIRRPETKLKTHPPYKVRKWNRKDRPPRPAEQE